MRVLLVYSILYVILCHYCDVRRLDCGNKCGKCNKCIIRIILLNKTRHHWQNTCNNTSMRKEESKKHVLLLMLF